MKRRNRRAVALVGLGGLFLLLLQKKEKQAPATELKALPQPSPQVIDLGVKQARKGV